MLATNSESWATVTHKGQVTIPKPIRERLGVPNGGKVRFRLRYDGIVVVEQPSKTSEIIGRLKQYANPDKPVDAYDAKEKMEHGRAKELGY